ncbi:hypothetical protein DdX_04907 [Ditylenchus destructor]|uniref:Aftiphilin clathrin-binding box domain-containing protein n=1 Tax=Ditylenchus destructor TaxID=166010 RepID=A0AAD4NDD3_9BILA|nr:hypothetical protein DdX_04907 [Ditylenchus destructor]
MSIIGEESAFSDSNNENEPCSSNSEESSEQKPNKHSVEEDVRKQADNGDDDFDDFGDFEEANDTCQAEASTSVMSPLPSVSADSECLQGLEDISTGSDLWTFDLPCLSQDTSLTDSPSEQLSNSLSDPGNPEMCDLFARFDLCDEEIKDFEFKDFETQSLRLWTLLCYVEETVALKFLWNKSIAYSEFLNALHIRSNAMCGQINTASLTSKLPSFSALDDASTLNARDSTNTITHSNNPAPVTSDWSTVDSLSVAPVEFDWRNSGLENPFTSSSTTAISACVLECDNFFSADGNGNHYNGASILEQELERMGLSNGHAALPNTSNNLSVDLNELIRKNISNSTTKLATLNGSQAKQYKDVNELSLEARALHDRLPDHTYMLADRLMFPLSSECEHFPGNNM